MQTDGHSLPSQAQLSCELLFAPTQERRAAAKRLLAAGCYRQVRAEESQWSDHAVHPLEAYRAYDDGEEIEFLDEHGFPFPDGCLHESFVECQAAGCPGWRQPRPYGEERPALDAGVSQEVGCIVLPDSQPALPSPPKIEAEAPPLEVRTSLAFKIQHQLGGEQPEKPEPRFVVVKPTPPPNDHSGLSPISW